MPEVVDKTNNVTSAGVGLRRGHDALEQLDLVEGSLGVVAIGLDDFESDVPICAAALSRRPSASPILCNAGWMACEGDGWPTYVLSLASQTVEKWPHPSFLTIRYLPWLNSSPMLTGW
jgi:hypothetical protein